MPVISGPITALAGDSTARVYVAATEVHPHAGGVMTDEPCRVSITNGVLSFEAPEGVGVLTIKTAGGVEKTLPIVVKEGYTLADALLAGDVEALPASKIDELAERLAGMAAGDQADLTGKLEETGDGELAVGAGYSRVNIAMGNWDSSVILPKSTYLQEGMELSPTAVSLSVELEYINVALMELFSGFGGVVLSPTVSSPMRSVIASRGLSESEVEAIPFEFNPSCLTSMGRLFEGFTSLKEVGFINAYRAIDFSRMFYGCRSLEKAGPIMPALGPNDKADFSYMFYGCESLKDGDVQVIASAQALQNANTEKMIEGSGLSRKPFYTPMGEPIDVP